MRKKNLRRRFFTSGFIAVVGAAALLSALWALNQTTVYAEGVLPESGEADASFKPDYTEELGTLISDYPVEDPSDGIYANARLIVYCKDPNKLALSGLLQCVQRTEESVVLQFETPAAARTADKTLTAAGYEVVIDRPLTLTFAMLPGAEKHLSMIPEMMHMYDISDDPGYQAKQVTVAVLDSGVSPLYASRMIPGFNALSGETGKAAETLEETADIYGHGTEVASVIIDATGDNVLVMPVVVSNEKGASSVLSVELGLRFAGEHADVINMSLDYTGADASEQTFWNEAIDAALQAGTPVVVASGNAGKSTQGAYPACYEPVWTVGAVDSAMSRASFSNYGSVDFVAPGKGIVCKLPDGSDKTTNGTSLSCPAIAALAAQLLGDGGVHSVDDLYTDIREMCVDLGSEGHDEYYGYGMPIVPHSEEISVIQEATCTEEGVQTCRCRFCGEERTETIPAAGHDYQTMISKATLKADGIARKTCSRCGDVAGETVIPYPKTIKLSAVTAVYNGTSQKPKVIIKGSDGNTIDASACKVTWSGTCKTPGEYTATIEFIGNYSGTVKKTFTVKPKRTLITKLAVSKRAVTLTWNKQAVQTSGYQIKYARDKAFTNEKKTVTITKNTVASRKITGLKSGVRYYFRIRTFKTVNGRKYYSSWSYLRSRKAK